MHPPPRWFFILLWLIFARDLPSAESLLTYEPVLPTYVRDIDGAPVQSFCGIVSNAGIAPQGAIERVATEQLQQSFAINFYAHHWVASAAIEVSGMSPAKMEVTMAVKIVIRTGVPRADTRARLVGSSPSRAMVKKIRLCP